MDGAVDPEPSAAASRWALLERWSWARFPLGAFVVSRAAIFLSSYMVTVLVPGLWREGGHREFLQHYAAIDGLCKWDCSFFVEVADLGYPHVGYSNFFPLYPLLTHWLTFLGVHRDVALLVWSNAFALGSYLVLYRIYCLWASEEAARLTLLLFVSYPFAFFQAGGYPESMMVFFTALATWLALRKHPLSAGVALGVGMLARHLSVFAGGALLVAHVRQRGWRPKQFFWNRAFLGLLLPFVVGGIYPLFLYLRFHDALAFWHSRANWGNGAWQGTWAALVGTSDDDRIMRSYVPFAALVTGGGLALLLRKRWWEGAGFAVPFLIVLWAVGAAGLGRYSASCWPAFLPLGVWLQKRPSMSGAVVGMFGLFQGWFFYLYAHQFPIL